MLSNYLVVLVALSILFGMSDAQGAGKIYTGHGFFNDNCPITTCASLATSCALGKYLKDCGLTNTNPGNCDESCTGLPQDADWTSNGGQSATGCTWACKADFNKVGNTCVLKECSATLPLPFPNTQFKTDATGLFPGGCKYTCSPGFAAGGAAADGRGPATCTACPAGKKAAIGDTVCSNCPAGTFSTANSGSCTPCPPKFYSTSEGTANSCTDCKSTWCDTGKWKDNCGGTNPGSCTLCQNTNWNPDPALRPT
jgi:hypothetical protein